MGRAFARLIEAKRKVFPFRIVAIQTLRHGSAFDPHGRPVDPAFGPRAESIEEFLDRARPEMVVELTTLNPATGEPAISHIRAAFARSKHVVTANKGPIAHAYAALAEEANRAGVQFRFESTVMDGAPVFNMARNTLPGCTIRGFTGVLNSTTNVVIEALRDGHTLQDGIEQARRIGVTEADASYDIDGWDAAAKTAALANVFMDAQRHAAGRGSPGHRPADSGKTGGIEKPGQNHQADQPRSHDGHRSEAARTSRSDRRNRRSGRAREARRACCCSIRI